MRVRIQFEGSQVAREMRARAGKIQPALASAARNAIPDMVAAAQREARSLRIVAVRPSRRQRSTPPTRVRESIARAVGARYDDRGVTVYIDISKMPPGKENLPKLTNQKSWRHPVFGNTAKWVEQRAKAGWFGKAIRKEAQRQVPDEIARIMERIIR